MFDGIEEKFVYELASFAATGHRFNNVYTLYKQSQQEGFQGFLSGLAEGDKHGYIELPTGVGKTALFIALILNYLTAVNRAENAPRVLIAVPTEKLAVQTAKALTLEQRLDPNGNEIFGSPENLAPILRGTQKSIRSSQLAMLFKLLK